MASKNSFTLEFTSTNPWLCFFLCLSVSFYVFVFFLHMLWLINYFLLTLILRLAATLEASLSRHVSYYIRPHARGNFVAADILDSG